MIARLLDSWAIYIFIYSYRIIHVLNELISWNTIWGHAMVKNNTLEFNIETTNAQYEKLLMLKKALLAGKNKEVNEQILLDRAREQSLKEIYLIGYLVNKL